MINARQIISSSIVQAFHELKANKLRTFLSLLGITIGIFCIISVLTVLDSLKNSIQKDMATLGSNVLYVGRWPWMDDGGEYKWWDYWRRPGMTPHEVKAIEQQVPDAAIATLCLSTNRLTVKYHDMEVGSIAGYAVMNYFDKVQNIDVEQGRYLSISELDGGNNAVVIGNTVYRNLFPAGISPLGKNISLLGRRYTVVGILKKAGQNMAGFDYDNSVIFPYNSATSVLDTRSLSYDPFLIIKAANGKNAEDLKYEVEGVLRRIRKVKPGQPSNFAINQLSQVTERLDVIFKTVDVVGWFIGGLSLIVGAFGIANIMFVTVKERTRMIGLKKAIGAQKSSILLEFLLEAIVLSGLGGLIGILLVLAISQIVTYGFNFEIIMSVNNFIVGIFVSIFVGMLAGFLPARAAARLDPVVAIRSN